MWGPKLKVISEPVPTRVAQVGEHLVEQVEQEFVFLGHLVPLQEPTFGYAFAASYLLLQIGCACIAKETSSVVRLSLRESRSLPPIAPRCRPSGRRFLDGG